VPYAKLYFVRISSVPSISGIVYLEFGTYHGQISRPCIASQIFFFIDLKGWVIVVPHPIKLCACYWGTAISFWDDVLNDKRLIARNFRLLGNSKKIDPRFSLVIIVNLPVNTPKNVFVGWRPAGWKQLYLVLWLSFFNLKAPPTFKIKCQS